MQATYGQTRSSNKFSLLLVIIFLGFLGFAISQVLPSLMQLQFNTVEEEISLAMVVEQQFEVDTSHAVLKHGYDAIMVRNCLNKNGAESIWYEPERDVFIRICKIENRLWGVQVCKNKLCLEESDEVTAFAIRKLWNQVLQYLKNCGATQIL